MCNQKDKENSVTFWERHFLLRHYDLTARRDISPLSHTGPVTSKRINQVWKNIKIRYMADLEQAIGASLTRRVNQYVELKDNRLPDF